MKKSEFIAVFQISKLIIFEVDYYTLSTNKNAYFTTSANQFIRSKKDFNRCGQAQADLLPKHSTARRFWEKWDKYHLQDLTAEQYNELQNEIETLKEKYNYLYKELDESEKPYSPRFYWSELVEFSKQTPKKN